MIEKDTDHTLNARLLETEIDIEGLEEENADLRARLKEYEEGIEPEDAFLTLKLDYATGRYDIISHDMGPAPVRYFVVSGLNIDQARALSRNDISTSEIFVLEQMSRYKKWKLEQAEGE